GAPPASPRPTTRPAGTSGRLGTSCRRSLDGSTGCSPAASTSRGRRTRSPIPAGGPGSPGWTASASTSPASLPWQPGPTASPSGPNTRPSSACSPERGAALGQRREPVGERATDAEMLLEVLVDRGQEHVARIAVLRQVVL